MKRVLVTGASGQLGLSIQDIADEHINIEFVFFDSESLDINDLEKKSKIFISGNFDWCINCAAYSNVEQAEKTPEMAYHTNAEGVKKLALACKKHNITLVHISTDYVFNGKKDLPYTPDDIPNPINEYGKSKLKGEQYIQQVLDNYYIVRSSWLYHKKHGNNFYKTILRKARKGETLRITSKEKGCPTNTKKLTKYLISLILEENQQFGVYHYTDGNAMTWYDFAEIILLENHLKGITNLIKDDDYITFAKRPKFSVLAN